MSPGELGGWVAGRVPALAPVIERFVPPEPVRSSPVRSEPAFPSRVGAPPDLRLGGLAAGVWLAALAALYLSAPTGFGLALVAALGAVVVAWVGRGRIRTVGAVVLLGAALGAAVTAARAAERDADPLHRLAADRATARLVVTVSDDPRAVAGTGGRPAVYVVAARLRELRSDDTRVVADVRVLVLGTDPGWRAVLPGQVVEIDGRLSPGRSGDLRAAVVSASGAPTPVGEAPWVQRAAGQLRAGLQAACAPLPDAPGGLLPGLVVGDTSRLPAEVEADFRVVGLTHLNAVSGANCAIVMGAVLLLARFSRVGRGVAAVAAGAALVGFVVLARPSPSVLRAAVMGGIALVALASGRPRAALPALGAAVTALVVVDPELAGSPGFALSVLATSGLLLLAPRWRDAMRARGVPPGVAEALAVPAAAQVACAPLIAGLSGVVSLVAVPANLLAVPAVAPATVLGVAAAVVSPVWPSGAAGLAWLASWPARWLVLLARAGAEAPVGALPWPDGVWGGLLLGVLTAAVVVAVRWPVVRRLALVVAVAAVATAVPVRLVTAVWPPPDWLAVACDVGQGDAIVLRAAPGAAVVVDAGPEPAATDRCLRRLGIAAVPLLVVSHFHADHVGGVAGVFRGRAVGAVVTSGYSEPVAGRSAVLAAAHAGGTPVTVAGENWSATVGAVRLTELDAGEPLHGTRSDANNNSLILRVILGGRTLLLAGDAEAEEQHALLGRYGADALRADVVKLAHHGSAFQDLDFLAAVRPGAALVSVGVGNTYGHPNANLLAHLERAGTLVLRTDRDGDLAVVADGDRLTVVARGLPPGERR